MMKTHLLLHCGVIKCPCRKNDNSIRRDGNAGFDALKMSGFTLLEVLIAVFIFAIIITTVFGSFHLLFANAEAVDAHLEAYEMAQTCFARMMIDLREIQITPAMMYKKAEQGAPPDPYRVVMEAPESAGGAGARLRFASFAHLPISSRLPNRIGEIIYYLDAADTAHPVLRRADHSIFRIPAEFTGKDPILCRDVRFLEFTCYNASGEVYEYWDSENDQFENATPRAVRVRLAVGSEDAPLTFETVMALPVYREKIESVEPQ